MKMKDDTDIDLFLIEKGLGYILKYLEKKTVNGSLLLPAIDVLRMVPEFEKAVASIREKRKIDWRKNVGKIEEKFGKENFSKYIIDLNNLVWMKDLPINNNFISTGRYLSKFKNRYFPDLSKDIYRVKRSTGLKIQLVWYNDIEIYILFNIGGFAPFVFNRPLPIISVRSDKRTKELYVEMRIFSDSDISDFRKKVWGNLFSEVFPDRIEQERLDGENNLRRFLHYVLKVSGGYRHKEIYEWLSKKGFGFDAGDYPHASQEIDRFIDMLGMKK